MSVPEESGSGNESEKKAPSPPVDAWSSKPPMVEKPRRQINCCQCENFKEQAVLPQSVVRRVWDFSIFLVVTYNVLNIPLRAAFSGSSVSVFWYVVDYLTDCLLLVDFGWRFFVRYEDPESGAMITTRREIFRHYAKNNFFKEFLPDLLGVIPIDVVYFGNVSTHAMLRLNRFLHLHRFPRYFENLESASSRPFLFRLIKLSALIMLITHWTACLMRVLDFLSSQGLNLGPAGVTVFDQYLQILFTATIILAGRGPNPLYPKDDKDMFIMLITTFIGLFIFAAVIGEVVDIFKNLDAAWDDFRNKMDIVNLWMRHKKVNDKLQGKVRLYYQYLWERQAGLNDEDILSDMPPHLRAVISQDLNNEVLRKVPLFATCQDEGFLQMLMRSLKPQIYLPDDTIVREGEMGSCMFFITRGEVRVSVGDLGEVKRLKTGAFFGEVALLFKAKRNATISAVGYVDVFVLNKEDVDAALLDFPAYGEVIYALAQEKLAHDQNAELRKNRSSVILPTGNAAVREKLSQLMDGSASNGAAGEESGKTDDDKDKSSDESPGMGVGRPAGEGASASEPTRSGATLEVKGGNKKKARFAEGEGKPSNSVEMPSLNVKDLRPSNEADNLNSQWLDSHRSTGHPLPANAIYTLHSPTAPAFSNPAAWREALNEVRAVVGEFTADDARAVYGALESLVVAVGIASVKAGGGEGS